jgi:hypothetical protein
MPSVAPDLSYYAKEHANVIGMDNNDHWGRAKPDTNSKVLADALI